MPGAQAISEMLPRPNEAGVVEPTEVDGKIACIGSAHNYLACARKSVQLNSVLDAVKDNLHHEQKRVMEMNFVTVHHVLSPIQVRPPALPAPLRCMVAADACTNSEHACTHTHTHARTHARKVL